MVDLSNTVCYLNVNLTYISTKDSSVSLRAYGAYMLFDTEREARDFAACLDGPEYGCISVFRDSLTLHWTVTQYVRTPFTLREKLEGARFEETLTPV